MIIYMLVNTQKSSAAQVARRAGDVLAADGTRIILDERCRDLPQAHWSYDILPEEEAYKACDLVLSIGGDGTMLHAARHTMQSGKPLLGVNIGRLGFLTLIESDELEKLHKLATGDYSLEHRSVLRAEVMGLEKAHTCLALNDVVLFKHLPEKTISLNIFCDDILVSRFRGDGVIFATPTGSTAYSMSAGGPILDARLNGVVVTQICAHIVHTPPLVFSSERILRVVSTGTPKDEPVCLSCDGGESIVLGADETVTIGHSEWTVPLVQFNDAEQLQAIDKKLKGR